MKSTNKQTTQPVNHMKRHSTSLPALATPPRCSTKLLKLILLVTVGFLLTLPGIVKAQTQHGSGAFTWDNGTTASWGSLFGGPYSSVWTAGNDAVLEGAGGTISLANPTVHNMKVTASGYIFSGVSTLTLSGATPTVAMSAGRVSPMNALTTFGNNTAAVLAGSSGVTLVGNGVFLLNPSVVSTLTGGLNLNGPDLLLDFENLATPTDLINSGNALNLGGGRLFIKGKSTGSTSQSFAGATVNAGGGSVLVNPNGGTDTTVALGSLTASALGGGLIVGKALGAGSGTGTITTTTTTNSVGNIYGGRVVYTSDGGTTVDWATTTSGSAPYALSAYSGYTTLPLAGTSDTINGRLVLAADVTITGAHAHNSLKLENTSATRNFNVGSSLTLESGGLLLTGTQRIQLQGGTITAGADSGYNLTINNYCRANSLVFANIADNGSNPVSVTYNAPTNIAYSLYWNNTASTYSGNTYVNGGQLGFNSASGQSIKSPIVYVRPGAQLMMNQAGTQMTNTFNIAGYGAMQSTLANGELGAIRMLNQTMTGPVVLSGDARIGCQGGNTPTIAGPISGEHGIDFYGSLNSDTQARFTLNNTDNSFSGNATVSCETYGGTRNGSTKLRLGATEVLPNGPGKGMLGLLGPDTSHVTMLDLNGNTETINGLFAATPEAAFIENDLASTTGTLIIGDADTTSTYSGGIRDNAGSGGNVAITKIGTGTLTLSGANTHSGATTISAGTLALGVGGVLDASVIRIASGATFDVSAQSAFTMGGSASLRASGTSGSSATIKGGTSIDLGSQGLTLDYTPISASGDLTSPALTISQGNLTLNSPITVFIGGGIPLGAGTYTIVSNLSGTISGSPTLLITAGIGGTGLGAGLIATLDMSTPGRLNMVVASTPNNITLTRTVGNSPSAIGATLNFRATLSPAPVDGTTVTFFTNNIVLGTATTVSGVADYTTSTLPYSGGVAYTIVASASGYSPDFLAGGQQVTYDTWINPLGGLWDTAGNWLDSIIADGTGSLADFNSLDITNNVTVSLNGPRTIGFMNFGDTNTATAGGWTLDNNGNAGNILTLDGPAPTISVGVLAGSNVTISAEIAGATAINKTGLGTLVLSGVNTFSSSMNASAGTLRINGGAAIPDASSVNLSGTSILDVSASETVAGVSADGNGDTELKLASGVNLTIAVGSTFGGRVTGPGDLTFAGPNTGGFALNNTNSTHSGITRVTSGRIQLGGQDRISPNSTIFAVGSATLSDGQLFISGNNIVLSNNCTISGLGFPDNSGLNQLGAIRVVSGCVLAGTITLADQARIGVQNSTGVILSGKITGGFGLNIYGSDNANNFANDFTMSNPGNDYTGDTTIENVDYGVTVRTGCSTTLKLGASEVIPNGAGKGNIVLNGADANHKTILDLNGFNETVNGVSGSASGAVIQNTALGTSILTVGGADASSFFDGNVSDGGLSSGKYLAITKIGTGTVSFGANSYKGNTTVSNGTLTISQPTLSTNSTVTIASGAVLQLNFAGGETNTVAGLVLNGVSQLAGLYDSSTAGGYLAGSTGKLLVVPPPPINPNPPVLQMSYSGSSLNLAWPTNQGWILQSNSVSLTATGSWFNYPVDGSVGVTNVTIPVSLSQTNVFFRMKNP
jgi:fibronectin-binding autotransporter adhesin